MQREPQEISEHKTIGEAALDLRQAELKELKAHSLRLTSSGNYLSRTRV
jgi:hypothetical protein